MPRLQPKRFLFIKRGDEYNSFHCFSRYRPKSKPHQNTADQADIAAFSPAIPTSLKLKIMIFKKGTAFFVNLLRILRETLLR